MMPYPVFWILYCKGWGLYFWIPVQKLVKRIIFFADEVDGGVSDAACVGGGEGAKIMKIYELSVAMVWS